MLINSQIIQNAKLAFISASDNNVSTVANVSVTESAWFIYPNQSIDYSSVFLNGSINILGYGTIKDSYITGNVNISGEDSEYFNISNIHFQNGSGTLDYCSITSALFIDFQGILTENTSDVKDINILFNNNITLSGRKI